MNHGRHGNPLRGARKDDWEKELCAVHQPSARKSDALSIECGRMAVVECDAHFRRPLSVPPGGRFSAFRGGGYFVRVEPIEAMMTQSMAKS